MKWLYTISQNSLSEEKIHKPKAKRLCPSNKISRNSSSITTISSKSISEKFDENQNFQTDLNEISLDEINNDFQNLEEEQCQNELFNILLNSGKQNCDESSCECNEIERAQNPFEKNIALLNDEFFDNLINEGKKEINQQII